MTVAFYLADKEGSKTLHFESTSKIFEFSPKKNQICVVSVRPQYTSEPTEPFSIMNYFIHN